MDEYKSVLDSLINSQTKKKKSKLGEQESSSVVDRSVASAPAKDSMIAESVSAKSPAISGASSGGGLPTDVKSNMALAGLQAYGQIEQNFNDRQAAQMQRIDKSKQERLAAMQNLIKIYQGDAL